MMKKEKHTTVNILECKDVRNEDLFENAMEKADKFIRDFVDEVRTTFSTQDNVQIHFPRMKEGQMRLRVFAPGIRSAGQNFATLTYRPQKKILVVNVKSDSTETISLNRQNGSGALNVGLEITSVLSDMQKHAALLLIARSKYLISGVE